MSAGMVRAETALDRQRLLADGNRSSRSLREHRATYPSPTIRTDHPAVAIVSEIEQSGLCGRGGAGFPTGTKLRAVIAQQKTPVVVVNGAEGEPASDKDKVLLTHAPYLVLQGALTAAAAIGASGIVIAIGREQVHSQRAMEHVVEEYSKFEAQIPVSVVAVPDKFVAGEESALVQWLNGGDAKPTIVPPRPFERGFRNKPTLVDNVETVAHMAQIANWGAAWFRERGTVEQPGTTLVTVSGDVRNPGVYETEMGVDIRHVVENAGGDLETAQAVLVGGYFGSWISAHDAHSVSLDNVSLASYGASVGCGVVSVLSRDACGLRETARILKWMSRESSGQCGMCVNGLASIAEMTGQIYFGRADDQALAWLDRWANQIEGRGACRMPDGAIRFMRSALKVFAADIAAHRSGRPCAGASGNSWLAVPKSSDEWR